MKSWIDGLTDEQAMLALYEWKLWARPNQLPPEGDWFCWMMRSGRGAGKTRAGAQWVISRAQKGYKRIALVGQSKADVRDTMIEVGESSILNCSPPWFRPTYEPSKRRLTWPNGCIAIAYSGDEPGQLRGPQHSVAWVDELAKFKYPQETWDNLMLGLRIGANPQVVVTSTPRPIPLIKELISKPSTVDVRTSSYENIANLSPKYVAEVLDPLRGTRLGRQEIEGEILSDTPGALWQRDWIENHRVRDIPREDLTEDEIAEGKIAEPALVCVNVAVDPAASKTKTSDETGITAQGRGKYDNHGYLLEDASGKYSPAAWATKAINLYRRWKADKIVAEKNQGGDMVKYTLNTIDPNVPVVLVSATRGKRTRAEPVASLYEQGRIHHVGSFPDLEDQLCDWVPHEDSDSPDRLDALVWGFTDLIVQHSPIQIF